MRGGVFGDAILCIHSFPLTSHPFVATYVAAASWKPTAPDGASLFVQGPSPSVKDNLGGCDREMAEEGK